VSLGFLLAPLSPSGHAYKRTRTLSHIVS
jgi:hypothetical protein